MFSVGVLVYFFIIVSCSGNTDLSSVGNSTIVDASNNQTVFISSGKVKNDANDTVNMPKNVENVTIVVLNSKVNGLTTGKPDENGIESQTIENWDQFGDDEKPSNDIDNKPIVTTSKTTTTK